MPADLNRRVRPMASDRDARRGALPPADLQIATAPGKSNAMNTAHFRFRVYVATAAEASAVAVANLAAHCRTHLADRHDIEVVDVCREPLRALTDGVLVTPTLVKLAPLPEQRIFGTLAETPSLLNALGLDAVAACAGSPHAL
ncbi:MAG TPA: circadian clock KaiB family protein [Thermohalobaculum sp.]|nr:circadian clock KaiB family protein [Thermohalobaculum sp.]